MNTIANHLVLSASCAFVDYAPCGIRIVVSGLLLTRKRAIAIAELNGRRSSSKQWRLRWGTTLDATP
jgi:hypothetical protein